MAASARFTPAAPWTASRQRSTRIRCCTPITAASTSARNVALDANGTSLVGYGYSGSSNSQNRTVQEVTFGFNQTLWKDAKYGALNLMGQYEYLLPRTRGTSLPMRPRRTHDNTIYFNLRYTLPGGALRRAK